MSWSRALAVATLLALLGACGFRPLYGTQAGGASTYNEVQAVAIGPIPDRAGQLLRNALLDRLTPRGVADNPRYRLDVTLRGRREGLAITKGDEITRANLKFTASFVLRDLASGNPVLKGQTRSTASFNVVRSDFANFVAEQDAERRVTRDLSEQILTRLAVFFTRDRSG